MNIASVIWLKNVIEKLTVKHHVETFEVEEVLAGSPKFRFVEQGERAGEDVYFALAQTAAGRYLFLYFIRKQPNAALILRARDMADKERRHYGKFCGSAMLLSTQRDKGSKLLG